MRLPKKKYPPPDMLICLLREINDLSILKDQLWYRIPVNSASKNIDKYQYLSFYQPSTFKNQKWIIQYYGKIKEITKVMRKKLFPNEPINPKSDFIYNRIELSHLEILSKPIISLRGRRILFVPTTFEKFLHASELNDLFHGSPLEDKLWNVFKEQELQAERQYFIQENDKHYYLDFAIFCNNSNIDVECNGDIWHIFKEKSVSDNQRNNDLTKKGWYVLRFSTKQLNETKECLNVMKESINTYGGLVTIDKSIRYMELENRLGNTQLELF